MADNIEPLNFQKVGKNGVITLRLDVLDVLGAQPGDWVVLLPGRPGTHTVIIRKNEPMSVTYEEIG
jgi:hypothetical protein